MPGVARKTDMVENKILSENKKKRMMTLAPPVKRRESNQGVGEKRRDNLRLKIANEPGQTKMDRWMMRADDDDDGDNDEHPRHDTHANTPYTINTDTLNAQNMH